MVKLQNPDNKCGQANGTAEILIHFWVEMQSGTDNFEDSLAAFYETKIFLTSKAVIMLDINPNELKIYLYENSTHY